MADDYWIETVGGMTHVGRKHHRRHSSGYDFGDSAPYMYTVVVNEDGTLSKVYDDDTSVSGPLSGDITILGGWSTKPRNLTAEFRAKYGAPSAAESATLQRLANRAGQVLQSVKGRGPGRTDEMNWNTAQNLITFYIARRRGPDNSDPVNPAGGPERDALLHASTDVVADTSNIFKDVVHTLNKAAQVTGHALSSIPVIGGAIHAALKLDPIHALGGLVAAVARGEKLDKAFLNAAKGEVTAIKEAAPYVSKVVAFIPGVGTGVAAAIAAGTALAEGRTITDAIMSSVIAAVPGGALGQSAARAVTAIATGGNVANAAIDAAIEQLPPAAQTGVRAAVAAAKGQNIKTVALQAIRASLPGDAKKAVDIATAVSAARNIQSATVQALKQPANIAMLASIGARAALLPKPPAMPQLAKRAPMLPTIARRLPPVPSMPAPIAHPSASATAAVALAQAKNGLSNEAQNGFNVAIGALAHTGIPAQALASLRDNLSKEQRVGFDHAAKTVNNLENPTWSSVVTRGTVLRGDWREVSANTPGAYTGRIVKDGAIKRGSFVRV